MKEIALAEDEYKKYPELKREDVQELAEWIRQHPEYPTPTEEQVIRFLFSCYFNMDKAKKCVQQYYSIRFEHRISFLNRDILSEELQDQLDVVQYGVIPNKDPNGCTVALHRLQIFDPARYNFTESCRLLCLLTDSLLWREGNMKGFIIVFDMQGVSFMHVFRLKLASLKLFFQYVQEGSPLRLKAVHVVNTLPIAAKIMYLIRPFMNKELLDLLHFHSNNYDEIKKYLPLDCLPSDFGGTQPSIAQLHEDFKNWMLELREIFVEDDREPVNQNRDSLYETKTIYSSDNLSDSTNKTRDLDFRLKGGGLSESKQKNKSYEKADSRPKINDDGKEHDVDESDINDANLKNEYIDARWQALCTSNDKEQVLVPCPTCGRKFSEEAAYRHFPICSRVKEKVPTMKTPKNVNRPTCSSPNSPSFINVMADETLGLNDKRDETRKSKPIAFTFTKGGQKCQIQSIAIKPAAKSSEHCKQPEVNVSNKNNIVIGSPVNSKKGSGNNLVNKSDYGERKNKKRKVFTQRSDGVRKSASIWRKSIKEFKTIADTSTKPSKVKESNSSTTDVSSTSSKIFLSGKKPISNESRGNGNISSDCRLCPTCGKLSTTSDDKHRLERSKSKTRKCFSGKYKGINNKVSRSAKDMREFESIPQHVSIKDNTKKRSKIESSIDSFDEKCEPCFYCGRLVRRSLLDSHSFLCERIKNLEVFISKDHKKQTEHSSEVSLSPSAKQETIYEVCEEVERTLNMKQYLLVEEGSEFPIGMPQQKVASMKCPCCSQGLDLRLVQ